MDGRVARRRRRRASYRMDVPSIMRVPTAGGKATRVLDGLVDPPGKLKWMGFIQGPVVSPDGTTIAMTSDLPDPSRSDVTLKLLQPQVEEDQQPGPGPEGAAGPPGSGLATRRQAPGLRARTTATAPRARPGSTSTRRTRRRPRAVTGPGYLHPAYSPDGKYLAATRTSSFGTDVVILDAATRRGDPQAHQRRRQLGPVLVARRQPGRVPPRLGPGRGPADGPARGLGTRVDRRQDRSTSRRTPGLDSVSRPDWFVPADQLPEPTVAPASPPVTGRVSRGLVTASYLERLAARTAATRTVLCVGVDPDPAALPAGFAPTLQGVEAFARLIVEASLPYAAAVKPNLAFFEAHGSAGMAALERLRAMVPDDVPFVADAKRGDIGSTAAKQAVALYDVLGADAVTVNPYLGEEAIAPLLERGDRFAYVLCRTSNPGAGELQGLEVAAGPGGGPPGGAALGAGRAASRRRGVRAARSGLVVGATAPSEMAAIRALVPGLAFLVPGVGAQGGEVAPVLAHGPATAGAGGRQARRRAARQRVARHRAGGPGRLHGGPSRRPRRAARGGRRRWAASLAVLP